MWRCSVLLALAACLACSQSSPPASEPAPRPPPEPIREAAEAHDLRVMLAEMAAARACQALENKFRVLESGSGAAPVAGTLWFRRCRASQDGTQMTLDLSGSGWRWLHREKSRVGAEFEVAQYVQFHFEVQVTGTLDVAYAPDSHILTTWFTPESSPEVQIRSTGDVEVETETLWGDVVAGAASLFMKSPDAKADQQLVQQAKPKLAEKLSSVFSVTMDLCTGEVAKRLGRVPQGTMIEPSGPTAPPANAARIHPGGIIIAGPYPVEKNRVTAQLEILEGGGVRGELMCVDQATMLAEAFLSDQSSPGAASAVSTEDVRERAELVAEPSAECREVALVTRPLAESDGPVTYRFEIDPGTDREPLAQCRAPAGEAGSRAPAN